MDVYILDNLLRRIAVIDKYVSFIWAERYSSVGDFEWRLPTNTPHRDLLVVGAAISIAPFSNRVMIVEVVERTRGEDGQFIIELRGFSFEKLLMNRISQKHALAIHSGVQNISLTTRPADIVRIMFSIICVNNADVPGDSIPFIQSSGTLTGPRSIPEPPDDLTFSFGAITLYELFKEICDMYNMGFALLLETDASKIYFEVYTGDDRTTLQNVNEHVIFSPLLDNVLGTTEVTSIKDYKNVAYVFGQNGSRIVYADGVDPSVSGFSRRVMTVDASDITLVPGTDLDAALDRRGQEALAKARQIVAFDGEIPQKSEYVYGTHYRLGDIIEVRSSDGLTNMMRVVEQIFVSDAEGFRSYPGLAVDRLITPGTWLAWDASQEWVTASDYWADA